MKKYFYDLLYKYLSVFILPRDKVIEVNPKNDLIVKRFLKGRAVNLGNRRSEDGLPVLDGAAEIDDIGDIGNLSPDYIVLNGTLHYESDIQALLHALREQCKPDTRLVVIYYSSLWYPLVRLSTVLGFRRKTADENRLSHGDIENLLYLTDFGIIKREARVIVPVWIPLIAWFANKFLAPLPLLNNLCLLNILVARPAEHSTRALEQKPGVSIIVPARNEAGNIREIIDRIPKMGDDDEVIFVEGHSTDDTWSQIRRVCDENRGVKNVIACRQDGKGKGDAVRKGFDMAAKDILMILDADLTVPPEDLPKFYQAIVSGKGEFINGSRMVYPMEKEAMRFFNIIGNKFFALSFTFVLGQNFKDTLCGTKVLTRDSYLKIAKNRSFFGHIDPFGDFDLIFGAVRFNLKVVELPIRYRERKYGATNISRWKHGALLLKMLVLAAGKFKFL